MDIGFIGSGDIARHMAACGRLNRHIRIRAVANPNVEEVKAFARRHRIGTWYSDYRMMLAESKLDAVYISTPHNLHYEMIRESIQAGCDVFCEKPVTTTVEDADRLITLAGGAGRRVGINYQYRYDRGCSRMISAARRGDLGDLRYAVIHVPWLRRDDYMTGWHSSREMSGGGTLLTQASHSVDVAMFALGGLPTSATARVWNKHFISSEVEDLGMGILELDNGTVIQVCGSMISVPERAVRIEIHGDRATALYSGGDISVLRYRGRRGLVIDNAFSSLYRSLEGFRRWVEGDRPYRTPISEAVPVLRATLAMYRASNEKRLLRISSPA